MNRIGDLVEATETVNPRSAPDSEFDYIDVSSTSSERLEVVATQRLRGKDAPSRARRKVRHGDVIFATVRPTLQRIAFIPPELDQSVCSTGYIVLRPKAELNPRYLFYSLLRTQFTNEMESLQKGASYPAVTDGDVRAQLIPVPSLADQKRIIAILDEAFAGIDSAVANADKNLANARELFESYLKTILTRKGDGWEKKALGAIAENLDRMRVPITKAKRTKGSIPYYGASGIVDFVADYLFDEDLLLVSEDGANLLARTYPIAFSIAGKAWVNNHAHVLRFADLSTQRFTEYYLNAISLQPYVSGMAQPKLNQKALNAIPIPLPPPEERSQIVDDLNQMLGETDRLASTYRTKAETFAELRQSLLQKAFSGELTAKEVDREIAAA